MMRGFFPIYSINPEGDFFPSFSFSEDQHDYRNEAIERLTTLLHSDPTPKEKLKAFLERARTYRSMKKFTEAKADYTAALNLTPKDEPEIKAAILTNRGELHFLLDSLAPALVDLQQAIEIAPADKQASLRATTILNKILKEKFVRTILNAIHSLRREERIPLLKDCLNPETCLGKKFAGETKKLRIIQEQILALEKAGNIEDDWEIIHRPMAENAILSLDERDNLTL